MTALTDQLEKDALHFEDKNDYGMALLLLKASKRIAELELERLRGMEKYGKTQELFAVEPEEPVDNWISVEHRLPEDTSTVLVSALNCHNSAIKYTDMVTFYICPRHGVASFLTHGDGSEYPNVVEAWQPAPAPA